PGKDSTSGHWEIGGLQLNYDFPYFPNGFPPRIIDEFTQKTGLEILGNKAASGTEILKELGEEHVKTGKPIVYTSADSVFQIAAHEEIISREKLYEICLVARQILSGEDAVARVIARPFVGQNAADFTRTKGRRDFSLKPHGPTMLKLLQNSGIKTIGIGKIDDLYAGEGLDVKIHTKTNESGINTTMEQMSLLNNGLIMTNLVDFDMLWGHRNNVEGFYKDLKAFDSALPDIMKLVDKNTILILTADHGNDPTTPGTDHSREYVPLLVYGEGIAQRVDFGIRTSFADIGRTVTEIFNTEETPNGKSFLKMIKKIN
ncbi:MAG: phosphopentomutase, partial [Calditrichia bacterium]|nr:phosphopentomutase [Calditrichia bacterium]